MSVSSQIFSVFGHFQNLNLLTLLEDLRAGRTARQAWLSGSRLCPVAHGLPHGEQVQALREWGQIYDLSADCDFAARHMGAASDDVLRFVRLWDEGDITAGTLLLQLEEIWRERVEDAEAAQQLIVGGQGAEADGDCGILKAFKDVGRAENANGDRGVPRPCR